MRQQVPLRFIARLNIPMQKSSTSRGYYCHTTIEFNDSK
jgi:hypothetical protein